MRRLIALLCTVAAIALTGCGSARPGASPPAGPPARPPAGPPATSVAFPARLPGGTVLAYAVRQGPTLAGVRTVTVAGTVQSMAVTARRRAYVSCRSGMPLVAVGTLAATLSGQWTRLLDAGRVSAGHSDPPSPGHRSFWFMARGRRLYVDFARHVRPAPCHATECSAALHIDSTLRALLPASTALSGFIAAHCPPA